MASASQLRAQPLADFLSSELGAPMALEERLTAYRDDGHLRRPHRRQSASKYVQAAFATSGVAWVRKPQRVNEPLGCAGLARVPPKSASGFKAQPDAGLQTKCRAYSCFVNEEDAVICGSARRE